MGLFPVHGWTAQHYPQDYAQSMVLAKLEAGCPLEPQHRCPRCWCTMNRAAKELWRSTWRIVEVPGWYAEAHVAGLRKAARYNTRHNKFIDLLNVQLAARKPQSPGWYAVRVGTRTPTIREWWRVESPQSLRRYLANKLPR